jgi:hypothetical protein
MRFKDIPRARQARESRSEETGWIKEIEEALEEKTTL